MRIKSLCARFMFVSSSCASFFLNLTNFLIGLSRGNDKVRGEKEV